MGKPQLKADLKVDADLLAQARAAGVATQHVAEQALRAALNTKLGAAAADERARQWAEDNAEAIAEYNQRLRERGLIGAEFRKW